MSQILVIAAGGALGSLLRFWASGGVHALAGRGFPYGTLFVNVTGSLLMGFLYVWLLERTALAPEWRAFLLVGLLGGFTTFSSFSIETLNLIESGAMVKAGVNIILSVTVCIGAAWFGVLLGRQL
ncbi:MAG: camphor resistance protein CrcB [Gammaproteobacteria bacterium RBG_16_57_12]|nr:MAG: camphor resistance protein CrcB [Gammaproteobacteria bacterium RBG_16_57_12]